LTTDILSRYFQIGIFKDASGGAKLYQVAATFAFFRGISLEVSGVVSVPGRLLHMVSHHDNGIFLGQFVDQFLKLTGDNRVQGRTGLFHGHNIRFGGNGAGDTEPLLLGLLVGFLRKFIPTDRS